MYILQKSLENCSKIKTFMTKWIFSPGMQNWYNVRLEQDRKPRKKPTNLWSVSLWQRRQDDTRWKDSLFNRWCWENWTATCEKMNLDYSLTPYAKVSSKWINHLNVNLDTMKFSEENTGRSLFDMNCSNIFFNPSPRIMEVKAKTNGTYLNSKAFAQQRKESVQPFSRLRLFVTP